MADGQLSIAQRLQHKLLQQSSATLPGCIDWLTHNPLPEPGVESWKYTPINRLYELLFEPASEIRDGTIVEGLESVQRKHLEISRYTPADHARLDLANDLTDRFSRSIDTARHPVAQAVGADLAEIIVIQVRESLAEPLVITHPSQGNRWIHVELLANTTATLIERYQESNGGSITTIELAPGAQLAHACNHEATSQTSWRLNSVNLADSSHYELHQTNLGGRLQRIDNHIRLAGAGAHASLVGCAVCDTSNRADLQNVVEHMTPNCSSQQRYHGIANHSANLTFGGRIHIHEHARGTDAHLTNKNMVLDDAAQINTKPELEIYNDDVSCSHGATIGRLDEDALFYLRSRGLNEQRAQSLLLAAFVKQAIGGADAQRMQKNITEKLSLWTTAI